MSNNLDCTGYTIDNGDFAACNTYYTTHAIITHVDSSSITRLVNLVTILHGNIWNNVPKFKTQSYRVFSREIIENTSPSLDKLPSQLDAHGNYLK